MKIRHLGQRSRRPSMGQIIGYPISASVMNVLERVWVLAPGLLHPELGLGVRVLVHRLELAPIVVGEMLQAVFVRDLDGVLLRRGPAMHHQRAPEDLVHRLGGLGGIESAGLPHRTRFSRLEPGLGALHEVHLAVSAHLDHVVALSIARPVCGLVELEAFCVAALVQAGVPIGLSLVRQYRDHASA